MSKKFHKRQTMKNCLVVEGILKLSFGKIIYEKPVQKIPSMSSKYILKVFSLSIIEEELNLKVEKG